MPPFPCHETHMTSCSDDLQLDFSAPDSSFCLSHLPLSFCRFTSNAHIKRSEPIPLQWLHPGGALVFVICHLFSDYLLCAVYCSKMEVQWSDKQTHWPHKHWTQLKTQKVNRQGCSLTGHCVHVHCSKCVTQCLVLPSSQNQTILSFSSTQLTAVTSVFGAEAIPFSQALRFVTISTFLSQSLTASVLLSPMGDFLLLSYNYCRRSVLEPGFTPLCNIESLTLGVSATEA